MISTAIPNETFFTTVYFNSSETIVSQFSNYNVSIGENITSSSGNAGYSLEFFTRLYKHLCCGKDWGSSTNICKTFSDRFSQILMLPHDCEMAKPLQNLLVTLYVIIIAVSVIGNFLVILTFIFNKHMRSTTNIFIVSLAGSDMLLIITTVPFNIGQTITNHWNFGPFACKLIPFMNAFSVGCSSLTLCCIALDRFYAIVFPFKLQFFQTRYKMATILSAVWIVSLLSAIPQATSYELIEFYSVCGERITECLFPKDETPRQQFLRLWMSFGILFIFPLMVMAILYGMIIHRLWGKYSFSTTLNVNSSDGLRLRQKRRAVKMLVIVITLFVVCWLPLQLFNINTEKLQKNTTTLQTIKAFLQFLAMSSACYNPIVYAFMNEKFRKSFVLFLFCKKAQPRVHPLCERKQENTSRKVTQLKSEEQGFSGGTAESKM